jgi:RNA polymerase sigma-70 factor (ECF subfamily)
MLDVERGRQAALATLYDRYSAAVYSVAIAILRDPSRAQDVAQEAFVRSWTHAGSFDADRGSVLNWLLGITRHLAIDELRRAWRAADRAERIEPSDPADPELPDALLERKWRSQEVREALVRLSPVQRQTVELVYFGGYTLTEVAARLEIPTGTVKSRLNAALASLRAALVPPEAPAPEAQQCRPG